MKVHYGPLFCFKKRMLVNKINDKSNSSCYDDFVNTKLQNDTSQLQKLLQYDCLEVLEVPQRCAEKRSNFSIDYILGISEKKTQVCSSDQSNPQYDWLNYTRYKPPKLQRIRKKESIQRRRLGRNPRIPFSNEQVSILEEKFQQSPYLSNSDVISLSQCLQLSESRIKIWFQNRRARERRDGHDSSKKGFNLITSFLMKTRNSESVPEGIQDLSTSAFRPCHNFCK